jgi:hypothetical protein
MFSQELRSFAICLVLHILTFRSWCYLSLFGWIFHCFFHIIQNYIIIFVFYHCTIGVFFRLFSIFVIALIQILEVCAPRFWCLSALLRLLASSYCVAFSRSLFGLHTDYTLPDYIYIADMVVVWYFSQYPCFRSFILSVSYLFISIKFLHKFSIPVL